MERTYYRRNKKPVTVVEHDDLLAVRSARDSAPDAIEWPGDRDDAQRFRKAGWHLVPRRTWTGTEHEPTALVLERPGGRVVLAPNRLVVKFSDALSRDEVDALLAAHDVTTVQELHFATNLRVVARRASGVVDVIELADQLRKVEGCEFAEPELVESIGARPSAPELQPRHTPPPAAPAARKATGRSPR